MPDISVQIDLSGLELMDVQIADFERRWKAEIQTQLLFIQGAWTAAVSGQKLAGMTRSVNSTRYAASISDTASLEYPFNGDEFSGRVISTNSKLVEGIEQGYGSFDMKPGLLTGPASRVGKHGQRYTTVPMSHSTPGSTGQKGPPMPQDIYNQAKRLAPGQRLGTLGGYGRVSKLPAGVNAEAIRRSRPPPMTMPYTWQFSPYAGMARIGRQGQRGYITYRRVTAAWIDEKGQRHGSNVAAFIHPGMAPNPVMESVGRFVQPQIQAAFDALVREYTTQGSGA